VATLIVLLPCANTTASEGSPGDVATCTRYIEAFGTFVQVRVIAPPDANFDPRTAPNCDKVMATGRRGGETPGSRATSAPTTATKTAAAAMSAYGHAIPRDASSSWRTGATKTRGGRLSPGEGASTAASGGRKTGPSSLAVARLAPAISLLRRNASSYTCRPS
jgi:hypothetical protein